MAFPRGLSRVVIWSTDGALRVELPAAQSLGLAPEFDTGELPGNDTIVDSFMKLKSVGITGQEGGLTLDALAIMLGTSITSTGTTPNTVRELQITDNLQPPYFRIGGIAATTAGQAVQLFFPKVQAQSLLDGSFQGSNYFTPSWSAKAISGDGGHVMVIRELETWSDLPATFPNLT